MSRKKWVIAGCLLLLSGCRHDNALTEVMVADMSGNPVPARFISANRFSVFIFLESDCPLSQNYTRTLHLLFEKYKDEKVLFYGLFPGDADGAEVREFINKYGVPFPVYFDAGQALTRYFRATVTPEVIVVDSGGAVRYRGAIDNWAIDLGKKRSLVTANYLDDALHALVHDQHVPVESTKPVGCFIEKRDN